MSEIDQKLANVFLQPQVIRMNHDVVYGPMAASNLRRVIFFFQL